MFSPVDLLRIVMRFYSYDELLTLCFELDVDYENLSGNTKESKARELIRLAERNDQLSAVEEAILRKHPSLETTYSPERVQQLQTSIMAASDEQVQGAFVEFTQQVDAYINEFNLLHEQMEEWKEVHNLLQDLQNHFAPCRSYIYAFGRLSRATNREQEQEKLLYQIEVEWRPCKRILRRLETCAQEILVIGEAYQSEMSTEPEWFLAPKRAATEIDQALFEGDLLKLRDSLSEFGDQTDQHLYLADKALLKTANDIMRLPRPSSYAVQ